MVTVFEGLKVFNAELTEEVKYVRNCITRRNQKHHILLISAFPKSGSTFLWKAIEAITGLPTIFPTPALPHANRTELDSEKLRRVSFYSFICRLHMQAAPRNVQLMKKYLIRPVVLIRNIADVIVSLDDHLHNEDTGTPSGHEPVWYKNMSNDKRYEFLIRMHVPWYLHFVLTWDEAEKNLPVFWLNYENLFKDKIKILSNILDFWGMATDSEYIDKKTKGLVKENTRKNVGVPGRGQILSIKNREILENLINSCNLPERLRAKIGFI